MYEVWWSEAEEDRVRAKFRTLGDALRFVWRYGHEQDARLRLPDGLCKNASVFDASLRDVMPHAARERPESQDRPGALPVPPVMSLKTQVAAEVTRRLGAQHSRLVERAVAATIDVLLELHSGEDRAQADAAPVDAAPRRPRSPRGTLQPR
jgi:hypothetical protein